MISPRTRKYWASYVLITLFKNCKTPESKHMFSICRPILGYFLFSVWSHKYFGTVSLSPDFPFILSLCLFNFAKFHLADWHFYILNIGWFLKNICRIINLYLVSIALFWSKQSYRFNWREKCHVISSQLFSRVKKIFMVKLSTVLAFGSELGRWGCQFKNIWTWKNGLLMLLSGG